jgi:hypothetical protein
MLNYARRTAVILALAILATGCGAQSVGAGGVSSDGTPVPGGGADIPPSSGSASSGADGSGPPAFPASSPPPTGALTPITPAAGRRERVAQWRLAGQTDDGRRLRLDVSIGGPPCDTVTGLDVAETATTVTVTVHAGRLSSAVCPSGSAGSLATARLEAHLTHPLGTRTLLGSA